MSDHAATPTCAFDCGPDTTGEYVGGDGFALVPACPVHGWMAPFLEASWNLRVAAEADNARLREALVVYVGDDCRELADGEGLTTEEARLTYSPRYRWGRAALAEDTP